MAMRLLPAPARPLRQLPLRQCGTRSARSQTRVCARLGDRAVSPTRLNAAMTSGAGFLESYADTSRTRIAGLWRKLHQNSDNQDKLFAMFEVPWLVQQGIKMLNEMEVWDDDTELTINIKLGLLDIRERYPWTGETVEHGRRLSLPGRQCGHVTSTMAGPIVSVAWAGPLPGEIHDAFFLDEEEGFLTQVTRAKRRDTQEAFTFKTVYQKIGRR